MKRLILCLVLCWGGVANAATCDAGYYLENGECKECNPGAKPFYCPGDDIRHACPTTETDYEELSGWKKTGGREADWAWEGATDVSDCYCEINFIDSYSNQVRLECPFNGENYWCDRRMWFVAGPGYYLSYYGWSSSRDWYNNIKQCTNAPANAHYTGPGTPDAKDRHSVIDANDCPWECDVGYYIENGTTCTPCTNAPANARYTGAATTNDCPWECDAGFGKSAAGQCLPLCTGGATKIHAGAYVFNVWRDKYTSPTLKVELPSGVVCNINLAQGLARGTINVDYKGQTYHVVN